MCAGPELLIASAVISAATSVAAGSAAKQAAEYETMQYREQAEMAKLEASNASLQRLEASERTRRANIAIASANGVLPNSSRSFLALQRHGEDVHLRDQALIKLGGRNRVNQLQGQANQSAGAGRVAYRSGFMKAGSTLIGGAYDYSELKDVE